MNLKSIIEAILFIAGRPVSVRELEKVTSQPIAEIQKVINELKEEHKNSGVIILEQNRSYLMSTNPDCTMMVKEFLNAELREKLTDAVIETLAIVAYKQPVSRAEIESIRGVNSQYTLRILAMRGLIDKIVSQKDARVGLYQTTHEFLQHLGLKDIKDLPNFEELTAKVKPPEGFVPQPVSSVTSPPTPPNSEKEER